jgi:hypothetical protein
MIRLGHIPAAPAKNLAIHAGCGVELQGAGLDVLI